MSDDDWVEVRSCTWPHEAAFFKSLLESEHIEVLIPNEYTLSIQPLYAPALGGVRVLVGGRDLARARDVLTGGSGLNTFTSGSGLDPRSGGQV